MSRILNRREVIQLGTLATAGVSVAAAQSPFGGGGGRRDLMKAPLHVPSDFVGIHFHHWPQGNSPAPTYGYGTVRSHDYGIAWSDIETAKGQFNWDRIDNWVQTHSSAGKTLIYTVYGTPVWASSQPTVKDAYGHLGGAAPPTDLAVVNDFVQALVTRYNGKGTRKIKFIEIWNEPHFLQNNKGFWWGTQEQLADLGHTIAKAAKDSDPGIKVLSPGFDGLPQGHLTYTTTGILAGMREFLGTHDATGAAPAHWFDAFAIHTYDSSITDPTHGIEGTLLQVKETLGHFNSTMPIYTTETGFSEHSPFNTLPVEQQASVLRRQAAVQAALGAQTVCFYSHDDQYCGNPSKNPPIATAINDVHTRLAGARLQQVTVLPSGQVSVVTGAGSFTW